MPMTPLATFTVPGNHQFTGPGATNGGFRPVVTVRHINLQQHDLSLSMTKYEVGQ